MRTVYLEPNPTGSKDFPVQLRTAGYTNVYPSVEAAKQAAIGRFGGCKIVKLT